MTKDEVVGIRAHCGMRIDRCTKPFGQTDGRSIIMVYIADQRRETESFVSPISHRMCCFRGDSLSFALGQKHPPQFFLRKIRVTIQPDLSNEFARGRQVNGPGSVSNQTPLSNISAKGSPGTNFIDWCAHIPQPFGRIGISIGGKIIYLVRTQRKARR